MKLKINTKNHSIINNILALAKFSINKARAQNSDIIMCFASEWSIRKDKILQIAEETAFES